MRPDKPPHDKHSYMRCGCGNLAPRDMVHDNGPGYWCDDCWRRYRAQIKAEWENRT